MPIPAKLDPDEFTRVLKLYAEMGPEVREVWMRYGYDLLELMGKAGGYTAHANLMAIMMTSPVVYGLYKQVAAEEEEGQTQLPLAARRAHRAAPGTQASIAPSCAYSRPGSGCTGNP